MPRSKLPSPKKRLNLELSQPICEMMERLRDTVQADSLTEIIRRSVALYSAMVDTAARGGRVIIIDRKGVERELLFANEFIRTL